MRMRDWEREVAKRPKTMREVMMLDVWTVIKHGNARHRNWLKRKLIEMAADHEKVWRAYLREVR